MEKHLSMDSLLRRRLRWWWSCMGLARGAVCWWRSRCVVWNGYPHCSVFTIFSMNIKDGIHYQYLPVSGLQKWIPIFICKKQKSNQIHTKLRIKTNRHSICSYQWPNTKISLVRWLVLLYLHDIQKKCRGKNKQSFYSKETYSSWWTEALKVSLKWKIITQYDQK